MDDKIQEIWLTCGSIFVNWWYFQNLKCYALVPSLRCRSSLVPYHQVMFYVWSWRMNSIVVFFIPRYRLSPFIDRCPCPVFILCCRNPRYLDPRGRGGGALCLVVVVPYPCLNDNVLKWIYVLLASLCIPASHSPRPRFLSACTPILCLSVPSLNLKDCSVCWVCNCVNGDLTTTSLHLSCYIVLHVKP